MYHKMNYSFCKRIRTVLFLSLLVVIGWMAYMEYYTASLNLYYEQLNHLENASYYFEADLDLVLGTVIEIGRDPSLSREKRITYIHEIIQPIADLHTSLSPHLGLGFYLKDSIDAIVSVTPWKERKGSLGISLEIDHPSHQLYLGGPVQKEIETVLRGHVARYARLIFWNGEPIGHVWANIPFSVYQIKLLRSFTRSIPLILFVLGLGIYLIRFIYKEIKEATGKLGKEIDSIASEIMDASKQTEPTVFPLEFNPLYAKFIEMNSRLEKMKMDLSRSTRLTAFGELAATVVHDIKNPLTTLRVTAQLGIIQTDSIDQCKERFLKMIDTVDGINSYLMNMLNKVKPDTAAEKEAITFAAIINNSINTWEPIFNNNGINVEVEIDEDLRSLTISSSITLQQAILNLIKNAVEAMPWGGKILLRAFQYNGHINISLSDTGEGISEENKPFIFNKFFSTKHQGTGIGLASSKESISQLGGKMWFESKEGKETTFYIQLPIEESILIGEIS